MSATEELKQIAREDPEEFRERAKRFDEPIQSRLLRLYEEVVEE